MPQPKELLMDLSIESEMPETPKTPTPTPIFLSSSPDPLSGATSETMHVQIPSNSVTTLQNIVPKKRGGGNSITTPERLRIHKLAPAAQSQF